MTPKSPSFFYAPDHFSVCSLSSDLPENTHVFSIDVEEWYHVGAYETSLSRTDWPNLQSRVNRQMTILLEMLEALSIKATLFFLGSVAKSHPRLVQKAALAGHEIAAHGLDHKRLYTMTAKERFEDIKTTKTILEDITGSSILGYRAPSFSLTPDVWDIYGQLFDLGFVYSSSIYPLKTDHYGLSDAPRVAFFPLLNNPVVEIPVTVVSFLGKRFPAAGGGYFRLMPSWLGKRLFFKGAYQAQHPGIFYMHPWEIDPDQPDVKQASFKARFRHRVNQQSMLSKVSRLLESGHFGSFRDKVLPFLTLKPDSFAGKDMAR